MVRAPAQARSRGGFALVLALAVMALLVLTILSLAGLLSVESRAADVAAQELRGRLNTVMAARLALAHLQQEAGPDQRATATGELAGLPTSPFPSPYVSGTPVARQVGQGQARWTGVWRSDAPNQPPAWLISGKSAALNASLATTAYLAQARSLIGSSDYTADQWAPWQTNYPTALSGEPMRVLVGDGSAGLDVGADKTAGTADDKDWRVALPMVPFPGATLGQVTGSFAYWIGDEGVKVRVNLPEPRDLSASAPNNLDAVDALRAPSRPGTQLLIGVGGIDGANGFIDLAAADRRSVALLPGYVETDAAVNLPTNRATFHDHSYWSAGVLADSYRGGLRRDLSLAFEMDDREFDISEYGNATGEPDGFGSATELYTTAVNPRTSGLLPRTSWFPRFPAKPDGTMASPDPRPRIWVPIWEDNPDNPGRVITTTGARFKGWSPVFIRDDEAGRALKDPLTLPNYTLTSPFPSPRRVVGPLWHLVRDYYRLYKELDWNSGTPRLDARAVYPNIDQFVKGGYRANPSSGNNAEFSRYDIDNAFWSNGGSLGDGLDTFGVSPDPMGVLNPQRDYRFIPRAVRGAYLPTLHRLSLIFSIKKVPAGADFTLKLFCTPVVALHNPYGVALRLRAPSVTNDPRAVGGAARLSFSGFNDLKIYLRTHAGNDPMNATMETRATRLDYAFGIRATSNNSGANEISTNVNADNFGAIIPETVIQPGETIVFSSKNALAASEIIGANGNVLKLEPGLFITGGFHADLTTVALSSAGNPNHSTTIQASRFLGPGRKPGLPLGGTIETWINAEDMYWRHWLYLSSFRRQSRANDSTVDNPLLQEVLGTRKTNSRASHALMLNHGNFNSDGNLFFGDPGSLALPVRIGPISNIRSFSETLTPGSVIGAIDTEMRVADTARRTTYNRAVLSFANAQANPVAAPHPTWLFSNPLAQTSGSPGHVFTGNTISTSMGMPHTRTQFFSGDEKYMNGVSVSWSNLVATENAPGNSFGRSYGGASHSTNGSTSVTQVDIPTAPPLSLGQLMHANVSVWSWFPYYTMGNSFAPVSSPRDKSWVHGIDPSPSQRKGGHTMPDMAYLMNHALWDSFFFSGAAPRLSNSRNGNYNAVRAQSTQEVLNAFANGEGQLGNTRMRLYQPVARPTAATAFANTGFHTPNSGEAPAGHRQIAGYLINEGAFNVNSTSVEAWTGFLASVRNVGLGSESTDTKYRFPRVIGTPAQEAAVENLRSKNYWSGFVSLTETQLRALAVACVAEVKARARFHQRTERDQEYPPVSRRFLGFPPALEPGTPFLGLTEFVNRYLGPTRSVGAHISTSLYTIRPDGLESASYSGAAAKYQWMFGSGTLESAIARTNLTNAPTSASAIATAISHNWTYASPGLPSVGAGSRTAMPIGYFHKNLEVATPETNANRTHNGFGAPGCLFQGDLLQALGPGLATRSDTFTIRAAGNGATIAEGGARASSAILELVVQRLPDYLDPRNAPETALTDPNLRAINRTFGRRFRVISARWLAPDQI